MKECNSGADRRQSRHAMRGETSFSGRLWHDKKVSKGRGPRCGDNLDLLCGDCGEVCGKLWLKVTAGGIIVAIVDNNAGSAYGTPVYNLGMDCTLSAGVWNYDHTAIPEIVEGSNFLKFEGKDKFSGVELPVYGEVLASCARFYGTVQGVKTAGSYKEYRGGFLLRY